VTFAFLTNEPAPVFDYVMVPLLGATEAGSALLSGMATNKVVEKGSLITNGDSLVLTIPLDASFPLNLLSPGDSTLTIKGKLVAISQAQSPGLVIGGITVGSQDLTLRWTSAPNQQFRVLGSPDLATWTDRSGIVTSATSDYSWTAPVSTHPDFFKLQKE
jgi:hypothetical protein